MTENHFRLLIVDVDGTLIGNDRTVSLENREALARVRDVGMTVSLSTGRSSQACLHILKQLSLDGYHTFYDGALVHNPHDGREVYVQPLDRETIREAVDFARRHDIDIEFYSSRGYFAERETWSTEAHRNFFGVEPNIVCFDGLWQREKIIKGGMVARNSEEEEKARKLCREFAGRFRFTWVKTPAYPDVYFINIISNEVSKGNAMSALASHLGIPLGEVMAVGDGDNDVSMLSIAGLSVAMSNAPEEVKAAASYTTLDVEHNGLALAIERFLL